MDFRQGFIYWAMAIPGNLSITFSICLNLTTYISECSNRRIDKLKVVCPHTQLIDGPNGTYIQPIFSQVHGQAVYQYSACGYSTRNLDAIYSLGEGFKRNCQLCTRRQRQANRLIKKPCREGIPQFLKTPTSGKEIQGFGRTESVL